MGIDGAVQAPQDADEGVRSQTALDTLSVVRDLQGAGTKVQEADQHRMRSSLYEVHRVWRRECGKQVGIGTGWLNPRGSCTSADPQHRVGFMRCRDEGLRSGSAL
jgi:hypothetical protein